MSVARKRLARPFRRLRWGLECLERRLVLDSQLSVVGLEYQELPAPIHRVEIEVAESEPPQYVAQIESGLPDGCTEPARVEVEQVASQFFIDVWNRRPAGSVMCTLQYRTVQHHLQLATGLEPGVYTVHVNDVTESFTVPGQNGDGGLLQADEFAVAAGSQNNRLNVMANDFEGIVFIRWPRITDVSVPSAGGSVTISEHKDLLLYTPPADFVGVEKFTYSVDFGLSAEVTVLVGEVVDVRWHNSVRPTDVNGDGLTTALDVLVVVNKINSDGVGELPRPGATPDVGVAAGEAAPALHFYYDVTGDGNLTALDALQIVNEINRANLDPPPAEQGEGEFTASPGRAIDAVAASGDRRDGPRAETPSTSAQGPSLLGGLLTASRSPAEALVWHDLRSTDDWRVPAVALPLADRPGAKSWHPVVSGLVADTSPVELEPLLELFAHDRSPFATWTPNEVVFGRWDHSGD